jgi:hypothetical protein
MYEKPCDPGQSQQPQDPLFDFFFLTPDVGQLRQLKYFKSIFFVATAKKQDAAKSKFLTLTHPTNLIEKM